MRGRITRRQLGLALTLGALSAAGCGGATKTFTAAVAGAEEMTLYEGLPHQMFERDLMESERRSKRVHELHGYWFYQEPLAPSDDDAKQLTQVLSDPATFAPFSGEKKCGGFHPDYAIEWKKDSSVYRALICFGCDEAKLFGPGIEERHDLNQSALSALEALLTKHRKSRPPSAF
jgi:hypothetical protein